MLRLLGPRRSLLAVGGRPRRTSLRLLGPRRSLLAGRRRTRGLFRRRPQRLVLVRLSRRDRCDRHGFRLCCRLSPRGRRVALLHCSRRVSQRSPRLRLLLRTCLRRFLRCRPALGHLARRILQRRLELRLGLRQRHLGGRGGLLRLRLCKVGDSSHGAPFRNRYSQFAPNLRFGDLLLSHGTLRLHDLLLVGRAHAPKLIEDSVQCCGRSGFVDFRLVDFANCCIVCAGRVVCKR